MLSSHLPDWFPLGEALHCMCARTSWEKQMLDTTTGCTQTKAQKQAWTKFIIIIAKSETWPIHQLITVIIVYINANKLNVARFINAQNPTCLEVCRKTGHRILYVMTMNGITTYAHEKRTCVHWHHRGSGSTLCAWSECVRVFAVLQVLTQLVPRMVDAKATVFTFHSPFSHSGVYKKAWPTLDGQYLYWDTTRRMLWSPWSERYVYFIPKLQVQIMCKADLFLRWTKKNAECIRGLRCLLSSLWELMRKTNNILWGLSWKQQ